MEKEKQDPWWGSLKVGLGLIQAAGCVRAWARVCVFTGHSSGYCDVSAQCGYVAIDRCSKSRSGSWIIGCVFFYFFFQKKITQSGEEV